LKEKEKGAVAELPKLQHLKLSANWSTSAYSNSYSPAIPEAEQSDFASSLFSATKLLRIIDIEGVRPDDTDELQWEFWRWRRGDAEPDRLCGRLYDQFWEEDSD
jgi:hypothetical protein